jgi:hypothetical protein
MRVKDELGVLKKQYLRMVFIIIITLTFLFSLIPSLASANPVAAYYFGWDVGGNILLLFFSNLIIDSLILLIPLFLLFKMGYEKKISELWIFGVPLLAIWGAYIDAIYIKINLIMEKSFIPAGLGVFIICLFFIVITFIAVIHFILGHRLKTGIIIGSIAGIINAIFWATINFGNIYYISIVPRILVFSGIFAFIFLIMLMLGFFIRKIMENKVNKAMQKPNPEVERSMLKASATIIQTFLLLYFAFIMMLFLI